MEPRQQSSVSVTIPGQKEFLLNLIQAKSLTVNIVPEIHLAGNAVDALTDTVDSGGDAGTGQSIISVCGTTLSDSTEKSHIPGKTFISNFIPNSIGRDDTDFDARYGRKRNVKQNI